MGGGGGHAQSSACLKCVPPLPQLLKKISRLLYNVVVLFIPWEVRIKKIESKSAAFTLLEPLSVVHQCGGGLVLLSGVSLSVQVILGQAWRPTSSFCAGCLASTSS